ISGAWPLSPTGRPVAPAERRRRRAGSRRDRHHSLPSMRQLGAETIGGPIGSSAMAERDPDCLFCKIVAGELPATIVAEDERTVSFMDIQPATRGHALVVPREHAPDLLGIGEEDLSACAAAAKRLAARA